MTDLDSPEPSVAALWTPTPERISSTQIDRFRREVAPQCDDVDQLWQWSIESPGAFWRSIWDWCGIIGSPGDVDVDLGSSFRHARFLPEATLNVAENFLADREGAAEVAVIAWREDGQEQLWSWDELRAAVGAMAGVLREAGVEPGDRVAAWMPHVPETVIAFLAAASVGAVFTSTSADFGVDGVVDRFGQTEPKVLIAADGYRYGGKAFDCLDRLTSVREQLPSVTKTLVVGYLDPELRLAVTENGVTGGGVSEDESGGSGGVELWSEALARHQGAPLTFAALPADHPLYILYSSGTTGKPKCIVHRAGGVLLKHLSEHRLHCDIAPGDRAFFFTTCGWMMWNWLVSALGVGATIVLYDGNPSYPDMQSTFDVADRFDVTLLGVSAKYIDGVLKSGAQPNDTASFSSLKTICSTGSPLSPEGFEWVYDAVHADVHLASMSGGTDLCGCLVIGDPTRPVYSGEIQTKALGVATDVFDDEGRSALPGVKGELVCTKPFPSLPLEFWGDDDGSRYHAAYFDRFDEVWAHGDYAAWTERGGMVIYGRSDATLNASGVRIGTAELYRVVEQLDEVAEAIAIGQLWDGDTRVVMFVKTAEGYEMTDELVARIRSELRTKCSPRHVPAVVLGVGDIPRTRSGKIVELAVTEVVHGRPIKNLEALANPEALDEFANRPELV